MSKASLTPQDMQAIVNTVRDYVSAVGKELDGRWRLLEKRIYALEQSRLTATEVLEGLNADELLELLGKLSRERKAVGKLLAAARAKER